MSISIYHHSAVLTLLLQHVGCHLPHSNQRSLLPLPDALRQSIGALRSFLQCRSQLRNTEAMRCWSIDVSSVWCACRCQLRWTYSLRAAPAYLLQSPDPLAPCYHIRSHPLPTRVTNAQLACMFEPEANAFYRNHREVHWEWFLWREAGFTPSDEDSDDEEEER